VGVELNTASAPLLTRVSGIAPPWRVRSWPTKRERRVHRSQAAAQVPGLVPKTLSRRWAFTAPRRGLSARRVGRAPGVRRAGRAHGTIWGRALGFDRHAELVDKIPLPSSFGTVGEPTRRDLAGELKKPGPDPRATLRSRPSGTD
jgi:uncharacterized protein